MELDLAVFSSLLVPAQIAPAKMAKKIKINFLSLVFIDPYCPDNYFVQIKISLDTHLSCYF